VTREARGEGQTGPVTSAPAVDPDLARLAAAHGVATSYEDWSGTPVPVAPAAVVAALAALDVDAATEQAVAQALRAGQDALWGRLLPPVVVARGADGAVAGTVELRSGEGEPVVLELVLEDGTTRPVEVGPEVAETSGGRVLRVVGLPSMPHGWHRLRAQAGEQRAEAVVLAAPLSLEIPTRLDRAWGWMVQLYSLRSAGSWGVGDYADLRTVVAASAAQGAGVLLANPLHAESPVPPLNPSPYSPSSRLFRSPVWLRLSDVPELAAAPVEVREQVAALRPPTDPERVLRDPAWEAKLAALELLWPLRREGALAGFRAERGQPLEDFALFCALAERHGLPWQDWPAELRRPEAPGVEAARVDLADRVAFWCWVQLLVDEQLAAVTEAARDMPVGVVHDLAVGVDAGGADAWALQDALALGTTVGAPPDSFNQKGQDWGLPPWRPDRLRELAYAPYRDLVRGMLRHAGGLRIDHVMGLFRLWWVPQGAGAADGTYVSYDADAMLAVLALEASRAGAVVVGEDLGTVEERVRTSLDETGVLGSAVLWFQRDDDDDGFLPPAQWPALAMASVTTHDLPTAAGFLVEEHVRVRSELGQLGVPLEQERARVGGEREALVAMLRSEGLVDRYDGDLVLAMHGALAASPCRLVLAAFGDAVGDVRQPNLPGTVDEYPNWRLPVADGHGRPLSLEELLASPGVARLTEVLREGVTAVRYGRPDPVPTRPAREP
jgi:4-alpha-glucanotransferase